MRRLSALRASFEELHRNFEESVSQLELGICPSDEIVEQLRSLRTQMESDRTFLVEEARVLGIEWGGALESLPALELLGARIEQTRRDALLVRVGGVLDRILSLTHREEASVISLNHLKEEAQQLYQTDAELDVLERLAQGNHPFVHLLRLLEENETLVDDEAVRLASLVEEYFGRSMTVAVLRKRLHLGGQPHTTHSSMELPAFFQSVGQQPPRWNAEEEQTITQRDGQEVTSSQEMDAAEQGSPLDLLAPVVEEEDTELENRTWSTPSQGENGAGLRSASGSYAGGGGTPMRIESSFASLSPAPDTSPDGGVSQKSRTTDTLDELPATPSKPENAADPALFDDPFQVDLSFPSDAASNRLPVPDDGEDLPMEAISVPSIEALAVAAMNEVLLPPSSSDLDLSLRSGSSVSLPAPPSSPKTPAPTFLTPLPLSVKVSPERPNKQEKTRDTMETSPFSSSQEEALAFLGSSASFNAMPSSIPEGGHSSGSMQLESFDAMLVRRSDPKDLSRCSPLTMWQEAELQKQEHGVAVLFGSSALGLEELPDFIEMAVGSEQLYVLDQVYAPHRFLRQIRQIASRRVSDGNMTFVLVTHQSPWDSSWVRGALELVAQMKSSNHTLRVAFVADPPSTWSMIPSIQPLQQDGASMLSLEPWHDSALMKWMQDLGFPYEHKIRRSIRRVTGNWSFALKFFYRQMRQNPTQWARHLGSLKQVLESRELAQKALRIMGLTHKTTLSILHKLALEEPATQESMERAFAHAPPRLITRALLWAERLSLVQYENYFWSTNPLVSRLLKALR